MRRPTPANAFGGRGQRRLKTWPLEGSVRLRPAPRVMSRSRCLPRWQIYTHYARTTQQHADRATNSHSLADSMQHMVCWPRSALAHHPPQDCELIVSPFSNSRQQPQLRHARSIRQNIISDLSRFLFKYDIWIYNLFLPILNIIKFCTLLYTIWPF